VVSLIFLDLLQLGCCWMDIGHWDIYPVRRFPPPAQVSILTHVCPCSIACVKPSTVDRSSISLQIAQPRVLLDSDWLRNVVFDLVHGTSLHDCIVLGAVAVFMTLNPNLPQLPYYLDCLVPLVKSTSIPCTISLNFCYPACLRVVYFVYRYIFFLLRLCYVYAY
jgi:hypothetical protein